MMLLISPPFSIVNTVTITFLLLLLSQSLISTTFTLRTHTAGIVHVAAATVTYNDRNSMADQLPEEHCVELAKAGDCERDLDYMKVHCRSTCNKWTHEQLKYKPFTLPEDAFYNLSSKTASTKPKTIHYDRFEGYVTLIIPLAKICTSKNNGSSNKVSPIDVFDKIEHLKQTYLYSVEVVVFPFIHPSMDRGDNDDDEYDDNVDCTEFESLSKQSSHRKMIIMEESSSLSELQSLPLFKLFLQALDLDGFPVDDTFYFIVKADGLNGTYEYGKSLFDIQDGLEVALKDLDPKEL